MTLIDLILDQYERGSRWKKDKSGKASLRVEEKHYTKIGKERLLQEAKELEQEGLLKIRWVQGYYNIDIEKVEYLLLNIDHFYQKAKRTPKNHMIEQNRSLVQSYYEEIKSPWIRKYTEEEVFPKLERGSDQYVSDELKLLYQCLQGLDRLDSPIFKRIFSKRVLHNSKLFEKELQGRILRIARRYHDDIEDTMEDSEVLSQLFLEEYSQELSVKGSLLLQIRDKVIDTGVFPYGTVLNTQSIKHAVIFDNPQIKKILTIENKANYMAEEYQEGTLVLFSHGYFSPLEREFLKQLKEKLTRQKVTYLHSGDLDYGGIRIFQYIRSRIFPELLPYRMDVTTFHQYKENGEPIEVGPLEKLKKLNEPMLKELIDLIIETELTIEQEAYL